MEREITLTSFSVKNEPGNRPGDFTTWFRPTIKLDSNSSYYIGFNRIISMFFTWTNVNAEYDNQKISFSKNNGNSWTDIDFPQGVWSYVEFNNYIKSKTVEDGHGDKPNYPISLAFDEPTFRVIITLDTGYQLDLTKSNFNKLIGFDKEILKDEQNVGKRVPNLSEDTDILNIHCDLTSTSLVMVENQILFTVLVQEL